MLIEPAVVAVEELGEERYPHDLTFGRPELPWATVMGVTIGDLRRAGWGRGWWGGSGNWRMPRWRHPLPFGVEVLVRVKSDSFVEVDPRFAGVDRPIVQDEFDPASADAIIREEVRTIGVIPIETLIERLSHFSNVYEDDE